MKRKNQTTKAFDLFNLQLVVNDQKSNQTSKQQQLRQQQQPMQLRQQHQRRPRQRLKQTKTFSIE
jgi:hypothetical protein